MSRPGRGGTPGMNQPPTLINLDHCATTPADPRVVEAMLPYFTERAANPAAEHAAGRAARAGLEDARARVAALIGAEEAELVFTAGATEANNLAIRGAAAFYGERRRHVIAASHDHPSLRKPVERLAERGFAVTWLDPDADGRIDPEGVAASLRPDTLLVTLAWAHNEVGTIQPIADISAVCRPRGVLVHADAAQMLGKRPVSVSEAGVDLLTGSAHKMYGPKGIGCLYVRRRPRVRLEPLIAGGGQERGLRPGTANVPAAVGFGRAAAIAAEEMAGDAAILEPLRDRLEARLLEGLPGVRRTVAPPDRLPHVAHLWLAEADARALAEAAPGVCMGHGPACDAAGTPSRALTRLGLSEAQARGALRFGLGRGQSGAEIAEAARELIAAGSPRGPASPEPAG